MIPLNPVVSKRPVSIASMGENNRFMRINPLWLHEATTHKSLVYGQQRITATRRSRERHPHLRVQSIVHWDKMSAPVAPSENSPSLAYWE
jgi:hypothetical protein